MSSAPGVNTPAKRGRVHVSEKFASNKPPVRAEGLLLRFEGASIDKQDYAANPCGQIGELIQFDDAVRQALKYQNSHLDTLVVVTSDHGHTSQVVEAGSITTGVTATLVS